MTKEEIILIIKEQIDSEESYVGILLTKEEAEFIISLIEVK